MTVTSTYDDGGVDDDYYLDGSSRTGDSCNSLLSTIDESTMTCSTDENRPHDAAFISRSNVELNACGKRRETMRSVLRDEGVGGQRLASGVATAVRRMDHVCRGGRSGVGREAEAKQHGSRRSFASAEVQSMDAQLKDSWTSSLQKWTLSAFSRMHQNRRYFNRRNLMSQTQERRYDKIRISTQNKHAI